MAAPTAPTIQSLQVKNSSSSQTTFSGTYKVSGLASTQGGKNWLNPITITLNATAGTGSTSTEYYVAFYKQSLGQATTASTFPADIISKLTGHGSQGFLLYYNSSGTGTSKVYNPFLASNNWVDITSYTADRYYNICGNTGGVRDCATKIYYYVFPVSAKSWQVKFDKNFTSSNMYTAVYVKDNTGGDILAPDQGPVQN